MSEPTNVTMTNMQAVNGSSTHPIRSVVSPNWNQGTFITARATSPLPGECRVVRNAQTDRKKEIPIATIARVAANWRCGCRVRDKIPAASRGNTGINQRKWRAAFIAIGSALVILSLNQPDPDWLFCNGGKWSGSAPGPPQLRPRQWQLKKSRTSCR